MVCGYIKGVYKFLEDNEIEFNSPQLIKIICKGCKINSLCTYIPLERFDELKE